MLVIDIVLDGLIFGIISPIARSRLKVSQSLSFDLSSVICFNVKIYLLSLDPALLDRFTST